MAEWDVLVEASNNYRVVADTEGDAEEMAEQLFRRDARAAAYGLTIIATLVSEIPDEEMEDIE